MAIVYTAVQWLCNIFIYLLLGRAILSWFINPYTANPASFSYKLYAFVTQITEPIVRPFRNFLSRFNTGRVDLSLFLTMIVIMFLERLVLMILRIMM